VKHSLISEVIALTQRFTWYVKDIAFLELSGFVSILIRPEKAFRDPNLWFTVLS
jgi:hypothetical protein